MSPYVLIILLTLTAFSSLELIESFFLCLFIHVLITNLATVSFPIINTFLLILQTHKILEQFSVLDEIPTKASWSAQFCKFLSIYSCCLGISLYHHHGDSIHLFRGIKTCFMENMQLSWFTPWFFFFFFFGHAARHVGS